MQIYKDSPLAKILFYKIGGTADAVLKIETHDDLLEALLYVGEHKPTRILPVGLGANLLVNDIRFEGLVLWFAKGPKTNSLKVHADGTVESFASVPLSDVVEFAFLHNLTGLEWAGGLPSSVGGAVRGNCGAFGGSIKGSLLKADYYDIATNEMPKKEMTKDEADFGYRSSLFKQNRYFIIDKAYFRLKPSDKEEVEMAKKTYDDYVLYRETKHPISFPSCGSVFKNVRDNEQVEKILSVWPDAREISQSNWHGKISMGYAIDRLGFSGFRVGGAEVSRQHANYIINKDNAKFADVVSVIDAIKKKFMQTFGFYPDVEVEIVY